MSTDIEPQRFRLLQVVLASGLWTRIVFVILCTVFLLTSVLWYVGSETQFVQSNLHITSIGLDTLIVQSTVPAGAQPHTSPPTTSEERRFGISSEQIQELVGLIRNVEVTARSGELAEPKQFQVKDRVEEATLFGCDPELQSVIHLQVEIGRFLSRQDNAERTLACVISAGLAAKLFPFEDPMGKRIHIPNTTHFLLVVGVLHPRTAGVPAIPLTQDKSACVFIPYQTFVATFLTENLQSPVLNHLAFKWTDVNSAADATTSIDAAIDRMGLRENVQVISPKSILDKLSSARTRSRVRQIGLIATASLVTLLAIVFATYAEGVHETKNKHASRGSRLRAAIFDVLISSTVFNP